MQIDTNRWRWGLTRACRWAVGWKQQQIHRETHNLCTRVFQFLSGTSLPLLRQQTTLDLKTLPDRQTSRPPHTGQPPEDRHRLTGKRQRKVIVNLSWLVVNSGWGLDQKTTTNIYAWPNCTNMLTSCMGSLQNGRNSCRSKTDNSPLSKMYRNVSNISFFYPIPFVLLLLSSSILVYQFQVNVCVVLCIFFFSIPYGKMLFWLYI